MGIKFGNKFMKKKFLRYLIISVGALILFLISLFFWINYPDLVQVMWLTLKLVFWPLIKIPFENWLSATIIVLLLLFLILKSLYFRK